MKKRALTVKISYGALALILFAALFYFTYSARENRQEKETVRVVVLGDSIMGIVRDETSVTRKLEEYLGEPVFNGALGGTCMSRMDEEKRIGYTKDALSMTGLSKAIEAGDFGVQQTVRIRESATEYFADTIDEMERIDFESVEILFIGHGLNDYHGGDRLDNDEDPYDEYTFTGALRSSVTNIQKAYPHIRIILVTPTYSWYTVQGLTCEELDAGYGILEDFVEAEKQVAAELGVEIIDLYHDFYPHRSWEDMELYTTDGLHPNEAGREMIAKKVAEYLKANSSA